MPTKPVKATVHADVAGENLTFTFASGETLEVGLADFEESIVRRLALHGLEQKLRDSYAGAEPEEAYGLAAKVVDQLMEGTWARRAAGGEREESSIRILALALARIAEAKGKPLDADGLEERLRTLSKSDRAKLRATPAVAEAIARIKAERGRTGSADGLLSAILG